MSEISNLAPSTPPNNQSEQSEQPASSSRNNKPRCYRYPLTDSGNAELFAALYKDNLRYDHASKRWLIWQEDWWASDQQAEVVRLAKKAARFRRSRGTELSDEELQAKVRKWARQSEGRYKIEAALKLAQSEPPISDDGAHWDSDPMLLAVKNGVVELETGKLRRGKQSDRITLHTDVMFEPEARCPRWEKFISEVFGGDPELINYVHKAVGYSLTGSTKEQVVFLCHGTGANGKSTFLEVLRYVLGSYAYNLPFSAFEMKARSAIPNDIAPLPHKRFVTALETNDLVELNEARIKALTGCDPITARFLYRENFTFVPDGKFWLAFNHKPKVLDDSRGFWRRVRLIPFAQEFSGTRCDENLMERLKAEASGVLNWAIRGCLKWQAEGLKAPAVVLAASEQYREESDPLREFLEDCCECDPNATAFVADLRSAYTAWAQATGNEPLDPQVFNRKLQAQGFVQKRLGHDRVRTWVGFRVKAPSAAQCLAPVEARTGADNKSLLLPN